jgi:hypothetical protein
VASFRIVFSRVLLGVPFPVAFIDVRRARDAERAVRVAELRLIRRFGLGDWRERADAVEVADVPPKTTMKSRWGAAASWAAP